MIKARVVPLRSGGIAATRLHLDYIERDGVEKDGSQGKLYSHGLGADSDLRTELPGERHQFRFIVSPEDGDKMDLTEFARGLMAQVERDTGRRLIWGAVNHHDTDNPHVHIVIRGVDTAGREVRFGRTYISEHIRWQAQHLVTKELGRRSELDLARQLGREVRQERFTTLDHQLSRVMANGTVDVRRLMLTVDGATRARLTGRLRVLETLSLAMRTGASTWRLTDDWEQSLRRLGDRGDIIKRIHVAMGKGANPAGFSVVDEQTEQPTIEGVVRRKGLHDELRGEMYAVIETERGQSHYVRLDPATAATLREGAVVTVRVNREAWVKQADKVIAQVAAEGNGVYDPALHRNQLAARPLRIGGGLVVPDEVVAANLRRLERLERYQLVARRPDGGWLVPKDLLDRLAQREQSHPRFRTELKVLSDRLASSIRHPGPTWLDARTVIDATRAPFGFGSEVSAAVEQRRAFLQQLGIKGGDRQVEAALRRHEQATEAAHLEKQIGGVYLPEIPSQFRGKAFACERRPGAAGTAFVRIADEDTGRFVLVPATAATTRFVGKTVEVANRNGEFYLRKWDLERGGR